jgi:hypothetical protein
MAVQRGRNKRRGDAYSLLYVEPLSDARTKLTDFLNSLLGCMERSSRQARSGRNGAATIFGVIMSTIVIVVTLSALMVLCPA